MIALAAVLGGAGVSVAEVGGSGYGVSVEESYLTGDVGDTVTLRTEVFVGRADGSRAAVPEGEPVGGGRVIEYELPEGTSLVGPGEGCQVVKAEEPGPHVRCDRVTALRIRLDKALTAEPGHLELSPLNTENLGRSSAGFLVTSPAPREERGTGGGGGDGAGLTLLGVAGGFAVLAVFLLVRGRARRTGWGAVAVGTVCAGLGAWSIAQGPSAGDGTAVTYPSGPAVLEITGTIWDSGLVLEKDRPAYAPTVATAPDPGNETATEVSAYYSAEAAGAPKEAWLTVDGARGRIKDPRRARDHMLETAAGAPRAEVLQKPRLFLLDGPDGNRPVLFKCQELRLPELPAEDRTVSMCAWADRGVRALVTVADDSLSRAAGTARQLRDAVQFGDRG